jgi:ribose-phosphate pyrophosphokinase
VDNIYATPMVLSDIRAQNLGDLMVVSPDVGGVVRARALAKRLDDSDLAIIDKRRPAPNQAQVMHVIGDVEGQHCIVVDDMVDTAGTLCLAAKALKERGAASVRAYCTHAVLSGRRSRTSANRRWTNWSSPTLSRCAPKRPPARTSVRSAWPACWPKPCAAFTSRNRSALFL